jgi:MoaA/NifB/PqqE/SkfB family radical SAM enzyme
VEMSAYSDLKILHHPGRLAQLRAGEQIAPAHLQLIISDLCSQSCNFCSYRWDGNVSNQLFHVLNNDGTKNHNPARFIPYQKITEILDDCRAMGVGAVQFTGGGEPTVHPRHLDTFNYALDCGLEIALVTHGVLLKPQTIETLTRAAWVRISLDAGTPETYAAIRGVPASQHGRALANLKAMCAARDRTGSNVVVGVGFVVTKDNWREVELATRAAKEAGADNFRISAVFQPDGDEYFKSFYDEAAALCRDTERLSEGRFRVVNMFGERLVDLRLGSPDYQTCSYMQFTTYIGADQNLYRCCTTAYNERGLVGSLKEQSFKDLWESQAKRDDFSGFDARGCERCMFNGKNRAINYAVSRPVHVNFV